MFIRVVEDSEVERYLVLPSLGEDSSALGLSDKAPPPALTTEKPRSIMIVTTGSALASERPVDR